MNKILFYTDSELYGGAEKQMLTLVENLSNWQCVVVMRNLPVFKDLFTKIETLPNVTLMKITARNKHSLGLFLQTFQILKKTKPDLIHLHSWNPMAGKFLILAAKLLKIKIINTQHDPFLLKFPKSIYQQWSLNKSDKIIAVSEKNRNLLIQISPKNRSKISTIHNGIELTKAAKISLAKKQQLKQQLDLSNDTKIILSAGTLHPRKGFLNLLEAFKLTNKVLPNWHLIIAGEGPQETVLRKKIEELNLTKQVSLIGFRNDLDQLFQISDVFALASHQEAFGLVIVEAMNAGNAIIATRAGGVPEIIQDNKNGLLVEPNNNKDLARALEKLMKNEKLRIELGESALISSQQFSATNMALSYQKIYQITLQE